MSSKHDDKNDRGDSPSSAAEAAEGENDARSGADTPRDGSVVTNDTSAGPRAGENSAYRDRPDGELTMLGHYRLLELIGRGGMGDVYRAHDESCNRTVAVKVLPPDLAEDATFVQRFEREAKAVAALSHPNIVPVYSIGEDQGHRYFAMAHIDGESLEDLLRRSEKLPLRETLHIITQCLAALQAAHDKGLIHRDIKPGNVLLQRHTGRAYLVDFGLVRQISETTRVTATGMVMGTVDYMAPEQARGLKDIDQRADLYAIGALLYHMLSGGLPFASTTLEGMMYAQAYEDPHPLDQAAPDLPQEMVELVHRLLAKDRNERPGDCKEVLEALAPLEELDFQVRHLAGQLRAAATTDESAAVLVDKDIPQSYGRLGRMRDRVTTIFRRPSPELLATLDSADKELQPAIQECEQRRHRLVALRDEGRSLLAELQEQIQANLQAASEAMQQLEAAEFDDARETAQAKKNACDEHVAVLQAQSHELGDRLDDLELQLAAADSDLATLQCKRGAVRERSAVVKRPRGHMTAAALGVLLFGIVAAPFLWNSFNGDSNHGMSSIDGSTQRSPAGNAVEPIDLPTQIDRLIQQLGDDSFDIREQASRRLAEIGKPALAALQEATKSPSAEVRYRVRTLIELIQQFFSGSRVVSTATRGAISVFAADLDGDGDIDVLSASCTDGEIEWHENNGRQRFTAHTISNDAGRAVSVFAADVDRDGDIDALSASSKDNKIAWYENDGSQRFTAHTISTDATRAHGVFATDVDGDGDIDVLSASRGDHKIAWYENVGSQRFTAHTISTDARGAISVFATDVDGDGDIDVLSASELDNKIAWYENLTIKSNDDRQ